MPRMLSLGCALAVAALTLGFLTLGLATGVAAQDYPTKPVRVIVPFPPGAINDTVGRMIATQLSVEAILKVLQSVHLQEEGSEGGEQAPRAQPQYGSITREQPTSSQKRSEV